jgi:hypothetical protein
MRYDNNYVLQPGLPIFSPVRLTAAEFLTPYRKSDLAFNKPQLVSVIVTDS